MVFPDDDQDVVVDIVRLQDPDDRNLCDGPDTGEKVVDHDALVPDLLEPLPAGEDRHVGTGVLRSAAAQIEPFTPGPMTRTRAF